MKKYVIALYIRLSLEDFKTDSLSISSQRMILQEHAAGLEEYGNAELMEFVDNGYSGQILNALLFRNFLIWYVQTELTVSW